MKKRTIALGLRKYSYTGLYFFAKIIHDGLQSNAALFPSPTPSLAVLQSSINTMKKATEDYGERGNVGGAKERAFLIKTQEELRELIRSCARYVMVAQPANEQAWLKVGFNLRSLPTKSNVVQAVQNLHHFIARNIPRGSIKLKWQRPLAAPAYMDITYNIFRSEDEHFSNAVYVDTVVNKATYTDKPPKPGIVYTYWIVPYSTAGKGVISEMCQAFASPV